MREDGRIDGSPLGYVTQQLPDDVVKTGLLPYLPFGDLVSISTTCRGLHRVAGDQLKAERETLKKVVANNVSLILESVDKDVGRGDSLISGIVVFDKEGRINYFDAAYYGTIAFDNEGLPAVVEPFRSSEISLGEKQAWTQPSCDVFFKGPEFKIFVGDINNDKMLSESGIQILQHTQYLLKHQSIPPPELADARGWKKAEAAPL